MGWRGVQREVEESKEGWIGRYVGREGNLYCCTFRKLAKLFTEENISLSDFCFTSDSLVRRSGHVLLHTTSSSLLLLRLGFDFSLFFFVREERHKFGIRPYTSLLLLLGDYRTSLSYRWSSEPNASINPPLSKIDGL